MESIVTDLRSWARGNYALEAATELLIRAFNGRFAGVDYPWIVVDQDKFYQVDFAVITQNIDAYSGGERRLLTVAASLGGGGPVDLYDAVEMDRESLSLFLAAIAHAAGSEHHTVFGQFTHEDGTVELDVNDRSQPGSLYPWPAS